MSVLRKAESCDAFGIRCNCWTGATSPEKFEKSVAHNHGISDGVERELAGGRRYFSSVDYLVVYSGVGTLFCFECRLERFGLQVGRA